MRSVACFAHSPLAIALSLTVAIPFSGAVLADDANLSTVVVTGTRGQERTVTDSPVPVDVISAETLQKTGKSNLREALAETRHHLGHTGNFEGPEVHPQFHHFLVRCADEVASAVAQLRVRRAEVVEVAL